MKLNVTLLFTLALLFFASCKDNIAEPQMTEPEENVSKFFLNATIDNDSQTKTTVDHANTNYTSGERASWLEGDEIAVLFFKQGATFMDGQYIDTVIFKALESGPSVQFALEKGTMPTLGQNYDIRAIYPAATVYPKLRLTHYSSYYNGKPTNPYTSVLSAFNVDGASPDNISEYDMMYAELLDMRVTSDGISLSFAHRLPMLRFSIRNNTSDNVYIDEIRIHSSKYNNSFYESGSGAVSLWRGVFTFGVAGSNEGYEIIANVDNGEIPSGGDIRDFYMMLVENEVTDNTDNFDIMVKYRKGGTTNPTRVHMFEIPRSSLAFLRGGTGGQNFERGKRYLFKLDIPISENMLPVTYNDIEHYRNSTTGEVWTTLLPDVSTKKNITIPSTGSSLPWNLTRIFNPGNTGNTNVEKIFLPASILCVGSDAFKNYTALKEIHMYSPKPPRMGKNILEGCPGSLPDGLTIRIPNHPDIIKAYDDIIQSGKMGWDDYINISATTLKDHGYVRLTEGFGIGGGKYVFIRANLSISGVPDIGDGGEYNGWE